MSVSSLKQLFLVAFLGLALVGCSSTPTTEESSTTGTITAESNSPEASTSTANASNDSAKSAAATAPETCEGTSSDSALCQPTNSSGQTASQLFAQLKGKMVHFAFNRSEISSKFYEIIRLNADYMALNANATVTIKGYCDERGTVEYNLALGERRAKAVKNALIAEGVSPSRINIISYGEADPINPAHTPAAWAENRRATFSY